MNLAVEQSFFNRSCDGQFSIGQSLKWFRLNYAKEGLVQFSQKINILPSRLADIEHGRVNLKAKELAAYITGLKIAHFTDFAK